MQVDRFHYMRSGANHLRDPICFSFVACRSKYAEHMLGRTGVLRFQIHVDRYTVREVEPIIFEIFARLSLLHVVVCAEHMLS